MGRESGSLGTASTATQLTIGTSTIRGVNACG
jgi:hypothetical protein